MKILTMVVVTWFAVLAGVQSYHAGVKKGRAEELQVLQVLRESRMQAYAAGRDKGWTACMEQF